MSFELNDSLDDLLGGPMGPVRSEPVRPVPAFKPAAELWEQGCAKCRGSGRVRWGVCFACKGAGKKSFKSSPAARAKAASQRADRKARVAADDMMAFKAREPEVFAWLNAECAKPQPFAFAVKMVEVIAKWGDLSEGQLAACQKLVARKADQAAQRAKSVAEAPVVDVSVIEAAFAKAREKAARPGQIGVRVKPLRLQSGDIAMRFSPGSVGSQWEGMLFAKSEDGKKLGSIKGGKFVRRFECSDAEAAAVLDCASNPKEGLLAFAKAWSKCGVCGRGLLNDVSIERGIGPICMSKFGF
jgi:hypothetical protein